MRLEDGLDAASAVEFAQALHAAAYLVPQSDRVFDLSELRVPREALPFFHASALIFLLQGAQRQVLLVLFLVLPVSAQVKQQILRICAVPQPRAAHASGEN